MSACPCGGLTSRAKEAHQGAVLTYQRCGSCGRCDYWRLTVTGRVFRGVQARLEFRRLSGGCCVPSRATACQKCDGEGCEWCQAGAK